MIGYSGVELIHIMEGNKYHRMGSRMESRMDRKTILQRMLLKKLRHKKVSRQKIKVDS